MSSGGPAQQTFYMADRLKKSQGGAAGGAHYLKNHHGRHGSVDDSPNGAAFPLGGQHHHYV